MRTTSVTLPQNLTRAYLELYLKGNSCDEFWFGSQPDDFAGPNGLCGGGAFREVQVSIDGSSPESRGRTRSCSRAASIRGCGDRFRR